MANENLSDQEMRDSFDDYYNGRVAHGAPHMGDIRAEAWRAWRAALSANQPSGPAEGSAAALATVDCKYTDSKCRRNACNRMRVCQAMQLAEMVSQQSGSTPAAQGITPEPAWPNTRRLTGLWRFGARVMPHPKLSGDFYQWLAMLDNLINDATGGHQTESPAKGEKP